MSPAETGEVLYTVNRHGNRQSGEEAAGWEDRAVELVRSDPALGWLERSVPPAGQGRRSRPAVPAYLSLTLSYNSKQLVCEPYFDGVLKWRGRWFYKGPTAGRWVVSSLPSLSQTGQDGWASTVYYLTTPDGAVHKLEWESGVTYTSRDGLNIRYNYVTKLIQFTGGAVFDFSLYAGQKKIIHRDRHGDASAGSCAKTRWIYRAALPMNG